MIKYLSMAFLIILLLDARENPFFPAEGESDMPISSNLIKSYDPLTRASLTLPSTARTIESVSVRYKNLDGSIDERSIALSNSIDWHLPLFITQNYDATQDRESKKVDALASKEPFMEIGKLDFISFFSKKNTLKLVTKDEMIRDLLLVKPHRIVCDFKREVNIRSYVKKIAQGSVVKEFRVGKHNGFYRAVIELDGYYRYRLSKTDDGYLITLL